ncbi:MAG: hypothetical protein J6Q21_03555 [Alistipes sp.]|nr:hypothetical protein [Alistipes sp.]
MFRMTSLCVLMCDCHCEEGLPDVAIPSKPTIDNIDSVLPVRRFFTSFRMT